MAGPAVRYPTGAITPHGRYQLLTGRKPMLAYRSPNDLVVFNLAGPLALADRTEPEAVTLTALKGLIPPWQNITQKGATQDGESYITSLYDPMEIDMGIEVKGRNPNHTRKVMRDWIAAWDAKQAGELSWFTHEAGRWWAPVRWSKAPVDSLLGGNYTYQKLNWTAIAHDAFWRSYDSVDTFGAVYNSDYDDFLYTTETGLGAGWTIDYTGGTGYLYADGRQAMSTLNGGRVAVARRVGYTSNTDNQVAGLIFGTIPQWGHNRYAYNDLWLRMNNTGDPGLTGVRVRVGYHELKLSYFIDGAETVLREKRVTVPFKPGDQLIVGAGFSEGARKFIVLRGVVNRKGVRKAVHTLMTVVERGTGSAVGAAYRSAGFGMQASSDDVPASILDWSVGDNDTVDQEGVLTRYNTGDQPMWDRYTLVGPGLFSLGDGPNSDQMVQFGPLLDGQMVQIRTDPRRRQVVDLTSIPPTPQQRAIYENAITDLVAYLTDYHVPTPSVFGIDPPQGNLYRLMFGRFSQPIPAKPPGQPAPPYSVKVAIQGGNAQSAILAAGTPLRRFPQ